MRVFFIITVCIGFFMYLDKGDMLISSYLISRITSFVLPIIAPLHKGWNETEIQNTRKMMEPGSNKVNIGFTFIDIPLDKNDHRHKQELYLQNNSRALYRIYIPVKIDVMKKVIMWFHGGGFVVGNIRSDHEICGKISNETNSIVINVNYGLAPENKFPIALQDSIDSVKWVYNNIYLYGGNKNNIHLIGESAGGNLVLSIIPYLKPIQIKSIISIYPPLHLFTYTTSHWKYANFNGFLTLNHLAKIASSYLTDIKESEDTRMNPSLLTNKSLHEYPNTLIILAKYDILFDDGILFAKKLAKNKVFVDVKIYPDIHGFFGRFGFGSKALEETILHLK
tara:strand:+ start:178 stop:1188 length:1011 start_codon:yes stop_codon:yes gene_type:complete